jgi:signal recognition particle subunit SRP54
MLDNLSTNLKDAMRKLAGKVVIDRVAVEELVKDLQRALIQADVNVKQVMQLSQDIKRRALEEELPKGVNARDHVLRIVYEELVALVGEPVKIELDRQIILMAGLQGSGKTTSTAKIARFFQKKGMKVGIICADTFRPGAYKQIKTLADKIHVPCFGDPSEHDARVIVEKGLKELSDGTDVLIIDTQGRHALEDDLIKEIIDLNEMSHANHRWLVIDAAIGQQAREQARAFHEAVNIDGVIITKMDGTAKGGGALSAVAETGSGIIFVGSGETIDDLEWFDPDGFISRLLGMGDLKALAERVQETIDTEEVDVEAMLAGKFSLRDMYTQLETVNKMGPLKQVMSMLPLGSMGMDVPDEVMDTTADKMKQYKIIMNSMTPIELDDPTILSGARVQRIAIGAGVRIEDVRELLKYYKMMKKTFKGIRGGEKGLQKLMKRFTKIG